jgi:hypothetical protein
MARQTKKAKLSLDRSRTMLFASRGSSRRIPQLSCCCSRQRNVPNRGSIPARFDEDWSLEAHLRRLVSLTRSVVEPTYLFPSNMVAFARSLPLDLTPRNQRSPNYSIHIRPSFSLVVFEGCGLTYSNFHIALLSIGRLRCGPVLRIKSYEGGDKPILPPCRQSAARQRLRVPRIAGDR